MKLQTRPKLIVVALFSTFLAGCGGGGGSSSTTTSNADVAGLTTPSEMDLIHEGESGANTSSAQVSAAGLKVNYAAVRAYNDTGTDYSNDLAHQESHVFHPAIEPLNIVNEILCFMDQMNPDEFVNEGQYIAMIDDAKCSKGENTSSGSSGGSGSSSSSSRTTYTKAIVESTRTDSDSPMDVKVWVLEKGGDRDQPQVIKVHTEVTEGVSESSPFGAFSLRFNGYQMLGEQAVGDPVFSGHLKTVTSTSSDAAFTFYESGVHGMEGGKPIISEQAASVEVNADGTTGRAETKLEAGADTDNDGEINQMFEQGHYQLAYNSTHAYGLEVNTDGESCLARDSHNEYAWRYDLYNKVSGAKVAVNSGFPFGYEDNGKQKHGYVGYWGVWTEEEHNFSSGDTITSKGFDESESQDYTLVQGPGRLIKYTRETLDLVDLGSTKFNYWDHESEQPMDYQVVYNADESKFQKIGTIEYGDQGPQVTELETPVDITVPDHGLHMWSDQLGGQVKYNKDATSLTFFKQQFLNGSETAAGEEFANGNTFALTCLERCPVGTITATMASNYETEQDRAFNYDDSDLYENGGIQGIEYSFSATTLKLTNNGNSASVEFANSVNEDNFNGWGYQSGPMVADATGITNFWEVWDENSGVDEYYVWETGINSWNRTTAVIDADDNIVTFTKPIQFNYTHTTANDRNDSATYNGETYMLQYGGNGDLWGFPFNKGDEMDRWYPEISLKDGVVVGDNDEYVVLARELERVMQESAGGVADCGTLSSNLEPENDMPTEVDTTIDSNTDDVPTVTGDPLVIGGENVE